MIRFPKMHIAQSVQNRILNLIDDLPSPTAGLPATVQPSVPGRHPLNEQITAQVGEPLPPVAAPADAEALAVGSAVAGESSADALQQGVVMDAFL